MKQMGALGGDFQTHLRIFGFACVLPFRAWRLDD